MTEIASTSKTPKEIFAATLNAEEKKKAQLDRLKALHLKRNEARKLNHKEVVEEDERIKRPKNWEAKRKRLEWEENEEKMKKECAEKGLDWERQKVLDIGAEHAEFLDRKKNKKNPDPGFSGFEDASIRQYKSKIKQIKPSREAYNAQKEELGEDTFYASAHTLGIFSRKDPTEAVDRMVTDLEKTIDKRAKYSRRRGYDPDADVDYINERNARFNKKLDRFYGQHTAEIKQNLERGTAL